MKVVDRKSFLAMPPGTLFAKFGDTEGTPGHFYFSEVRIKDDPRGDNDWYDVGFTDGLQGAHDSGAWADKVQTMVDGTDVPLLFDVVTADGLFDDKQLFAVFSTADVDRLIVRLQEARGLSEDDAPLTTTGAEIMAKDLTARAAEAALNPVYRTDARPSPSTVTDEGLVERVARAIADAVAAQSDNGVPPKWSEWRDEARAAVEASGHTALLREIEVLRGLLGRIHACRIEGRNGRFVNLARLKPAMDDLDAALSRPTHE